MKRAWGVIMWAILALALLALAAALAVGGSLSQPRWVTALHYSCEAPGGGHISYTLTGRYAGGWRDAEQFSAEMVSAYAPEGIAVIPGEYTAVKTVNVNTALALKELLWDEMKLQGWPRSTEEGQLTWTLTVTFDNGKTYERGGSGLPPAGMERVLACFPEPVRWNP